MNDLQDLPRLTAPLAASALTSSPVLVITGARQTGKSTLARRLGAQHGHRYATLDDLSILERAREAPEALVAGRERLVLDEVQRAPDLLVAVKRAVDEQREPGRFILTGSADLLLMDRVAETLAGRAVYLTLWPLTRRERLGQAKAGRWEDLFATAPPDWPELLAADPTPAEDWRNAARLGGYPVPAYRLRTANDRDRWHAGYTHTYLERDLRDLSAVGSLVDFRRLMRAIALRLGNLVNQTELGRDVGLSQPTVHRHLGLLEVSYQVVRVPPYSVNRTRRLIKSPKVYWSDTALALHLAGEEEPRGAHLENLVLTDLLAWSGAAVRPPEILFWRTTAGEEVDFVVEWKGHLLPIEVKATERLGLNDTRSLRAFAAEYPELALPGLLLYTGERVEWLTKEVLAVPWWRVV